MTKEILEAIQTIKKYFQTPENFQTKHSKVEGALISNWMDMITTEFVEKHIRPELQSEAQNNNIIIDMGAKA